MLARGTTTFTVVTEEAFYQSALLQMRYQLAVKAALLVPVPPAVFTPPGSIQSLCYQVFMEL